MRQDTGIHYFAYGSNLDASRVEARLGRRPPAHLARLRGWRLAFNKKDSPVFANIVPAPGDEVWGVVWECPPEDLLRLDCFEGVSGGHYRRLPVEVETADGRMLPAITYVACDDRIVAETAPAAWYAGHILRGAREHGLPADYIARLERLCGLASP